MKKLSKYILGPILLFGLSLFSKCEKEDFGGLPVDGAGNVYDTVVIGTQTWMAENLKTTSYNDGSLIPQLDKSEEWANSNTAGYCWYDNNPVNKDVYGALYNVKAARVETLCPKGWHLPTSDEWTTLFNYLGGKDEATHKLKETGSTYWLNPNEKANNITGFSARAAGVRAYDGRFLYIKNFAYWWTSSIINDNSNYRIYMTTTFTQIDKSYFNNGFSVRCIKDD
jgi:uncharacterized protein (TIGR02145 family)